MQGNILVLDCGGYNIKTKYVSADKHVRIVPNSIVKAKNERKRVFIGDQIEQCTDFSGLYFTLPYEKGFLINFDVQHQIWDYVLSKECMNTDPKDTTLILTQPHFTFQSTLEALNEAVFEDYEFKGYCRTNAPMLSSMHAQSIQPDSLCSLIVDSGFSFTHISPFCRNQLIDESVVRISVGGKVLTNHLKDSISYRQLNVMEETYVVNQCKEDCCFVSSKFNEDMLQAKKPCSENGIAVDYVLPDYDQVMRGFTKGVTAKNEEQQCIRMNAERFSVPELLFHPSDVGIDQMGVAEACGYVINKCPELLRPHLCSNIVLTGGNCLFHGFKERFVQDVRSAVRDLYDVKVHLPESPIEFACRGADHFVQSTQYRKMVVTKQEYNEYGHNVCMNKFDNPTLT